MGPGDISRGAKKHIKETLIYLALLTKYIPGGQTFKILASGRGYFEAMAIAPLKMIRTDEIGPEIKKYLDEIVTHLCRMSTELQHPIFYAHLQDESFQREVIAPLRELSGWGARDSKAAEEFAQSIMKEIGNSTYSESSGKLFSIIKTGMESANGNAVIWEIHKILAAKTEKK